MIARLVLQDLRCGKARFICAAAGIAVSVAAVVFTTSLAATNAAQAPLMAQKAMAPWKAFRAGDMRATPRAPRAARQNLRAPDMALPAIHMTVDYRPGGHVLQGPPMRAVLSKAPRNPYAALSLAQGRWPDDSSPEHEVVCVKNSMRRFGAAAPQLGEALKFVGREGTMTAKIVGYIDGDVKIPPQFPSVFANDAAYAALAGEEHGKIEFFRDAPEAVGDGGEIFTPDSPEVAGFYKGDEQRRMDYATPLMLVAAILTALSLLVNSLLLSVEANRKNLATLRMTGMTRSGAVAFVAVEALLSGAAGWVVGALAAMCALAAYVAADAAAFPAGVAFDFGRMLLTLGVLPFVIFAAILLALRPALKVRPMDALAVAPRPRRRGMVVAFALGFAAFVAVEVWGASLMRSFVPSLEWPDAIVSILPGGASSFDIEKLRGIEGVRRISELLPLQVYLDVDEGEAAPAPSRRETAAPAGRRPKAAPNALFLAAEWLPQFRFLEGDHASAQEGIAAGGVVITEMMARAHGLHLGGEIPLRLESRQGRQIVKLPIVGVIDLNWHMVTSRGLVRGMNRMPVMTDGPVFASFDTVESLDARPAFMVKMTHLWVEYEDGFAEKCGGVFPAGRKIEEEIAHRLGDPVTSTVRLHARDEIADGTLAHGSDVIGAAARVPFVFLFILAIGFTAMLVAEADARVHEFATLRAVGATRRHLVARLAAGAVATALWGMAIALPLGAAAGWLFSIQTAKIWPGMPHWFVLPWRIVAEGAVGALAFALVFAVPSSMALVERLTRRR